MIGTGDATIMDEIILHFLQGYEDEWECERKKRKTCRSGSVVNVDRADLGCGEIGPERFEKILIGKIDILIVQTVWVGRCRLERQSPFCREETGLAFALGEEDGSDVDVEIKAGVGEDVGELLGGDKVLDGSEIVETPFVELASGYVVVGEEEQSAWRQLEMGVADELG
jgi:hypothetical protein